MTNNSDEYLKSNNWILTSCRLVSQLYEILTRIYKILTEYIEYVDQRQVIKSIMENQANWKRRWRDGGFVPVGTVSYLNTLHSSTKCCFGFCSDWVSSQNIEKIFIRQIPSHIEASPSIIFRYALESQALIDVFEIWQFWWLITNILMCLGYISRIPQA